MNRNEGLIQNAISKSWRGREKHEVIKQHSLASVQQKICPCCRSVCIVGREQSEGSGII